LLALSPLQLTRAAHSLLGQGYLLGDGFRSLCFGALTLDFRIFLRLTWTSHA
jgi:hypothetical protein